MHTVNVRRDVQDDFYRYKMPKLMSKIEGKGNGIKTVIPNMSDVARSLSRPPSYTTKYFGCELGAQVKCDDKTDRYIVNGVHEPEKLQNLLDGFITKFVLCGSCLNPETNLVFTKDGRILKDCQACGQKTDCDMRHRLSTFILKNPPDIVQTTSKREKYSKKVAAAADGQAVEALESPVSNGTASESGRSKKKKSSLEEGVENMHLQDADEDETGLQEFVDYVGANPHASAAEFHAKADEFWLKDDKAVSVLTQLIFTSNILKELPEKAEYYTVFFEAAASEKAKVKLQKGILVGLEKLVGISHHDALVPKFPLILKAFYDNDILDEDVLLEWSRKKSRKNVDKKVAKELHAKAEPFITWLKEADEEESGSEDTSSS